MTLEEFDRVCGIIKYTFELTHKCEIEAIDEQIEEAKLKDIFSEMQELGLIVYRKKKGDYFIPWHQNFYGDNTIDSYRHKLIADCLKDNEEYQKLTEEEIKLSAQLSKVKGKLARIEFAYEYKQDSYISIAEQIKSLKVSDEPDDIIEI